jgi:hypothetical protein
MEPINPNYLISIDSETGDYFLGAHKLKTQAQIDSVIKYELNERAPNKAPCNKLRDINTAPQAIGFQPAFSRSS